MVGVPGRSKACHTCKRRKLGANLKCDRLRPSCRRCMSAGLSCEGYERASIFVNSTQGSHSNFSLRPYSPRRLSEQTAASTQAAAPLLDISLERTAAEAKYVFLYWRFLLPKNGQQFPLQAARHSTTGWTQVVQELSQKNDGVRVGLLANALALVGQQTGQTSVVAEAWRMYSQTLQTLARSLPHVSEQGTAIDAKLMTSALLAAFELLQVSDDHRSCLHGMTWLRHSTGQKAIILANGPESYVEGHAHRLFVDGRLHLIYLEIHNRTRSPFNSPEWKSIPWSKISKSPKDELVDILLEIPGLLEDLGLHLNDQTQEQLQTRCRICDTQLRRWSTSSGEASVSFADRLISTNTSQVSNPSPEDFAMAHLSMIYWATCSMLYQIMHRTADDDTDPWLYCHKILLMVAFFQRPDMGAIFINFVGFPVGVVVSFLARDVDPRATDLSELLQNIFQNQHWGSQLRAFLETWPWKDPGETRVITARARRRAQ
ncbi:c6 zinc finger domain-containing protein [Fusarium mexicanum]|uniref:C6 zinc finger domain-containing protein n=1 Tax=Fusarium mexicanum TaxID=751941 RepID=A0A8H5II64_9HYPO|nr:c6 zinc finger domain-containing protein [Fusarium mexicanum]